MQKQQTIYKARGRRLHKHDYKQHHNTVARMIHWNISKNVNVAVMKNGENIVETVAKMSIKRKK